MRLYLCCDYVRSVLISCSPRSPVCLFVVCVCTTPGVNNADYTPPKFITLFTDVGLLTPSAVSDQLITLYN